MTGLPELGARVRVWPMPGRRVQMGEAPVDAAGGGRWMPSAGCDVLWSTHCMEQLRGGDLLLHPPPCEKHDFPGGDDRCCRCGRTKVEAEAYDAGFAQLDA